MRLSASAFKPRLRKSGREHDGKRFPSHLAWLRKRPCLVEGRKGHICKGRMEAAHVDSAGGKGIGLKVADFHAVPLCSDAHALLHAHGQDTWQAYFEVDLIAAGKQYAAASPHKHLWEAANE